ncbi:IPT/TIG domain-containing protein (plasmid) [Deinococcus sp. KNUC1210]|uniref:IPT/TIG domain-containing protein n=1 Tax=Deinococcus sp. KNUC1210 TaxID=2917691 RepID=UPI001EF0ADC8|nr:IPT/TIG domain-containing protein [Deinococcus sp. KNUC1210]ULH18157.1 IPT/TIG domain-containing protein [Deinococcus sp. KNUC1210]
MRRALFALPLTALLAACGSATTSVTSDPTPVTSQPTPAQATTGQLYEVKFQNIGTPTATSSVSPVTAGLNAQALQDVDERNLVFTPLTVDTFVVSGKRYIEAVYNVKNNTGATIKHLTFVPVDTDPDPAAATPSTTDPTVGTTYFKSLKRFDGSDTSSRATDLTPITGRIYNKPSQQDVTDPDATPYTALDTSPLHPVAPTGLIVAGRANSGWRNGTILPNGSSTTVTFAVSVANSNAQTDPFTFSLMVAEGDDVRTPTVTGITPNQGAVAGGTSVTVSGSNFASGVTVKFGGMAATNVVINSATNLTAVSPPSAAAGTVDVVVSDGDDTSALSTADQFTYVAAPTVTGISPNLGLIAGVLR